MVDDDRPRGLGSSGYRAKRDSVGVDRATAVLKGTTRGQAAQTARLGRVLGALCGVVLLGLVALGGCASPMASAKLSGAQPSPVPTGVATGAPATPAVSAATTTPIGTLGQAGASGEAKATQTAVATATPQPAARNVGETRQLTVEEHAIVAREVDSPNHFEYARRIDPNILEKRLYWRTPGPASRVDRANQVLGKFGYRLASKERPGCPDCEVYDLYRGGALVKGDLLAVGPVAANRSGTDFALVVEGDKGAFLVRNGSIAAWNEGKHAFTRPVFVGDDLVTVETEDQRRFAVRRAGKTVHSVAAGLRGVDHPIKGLWSWQSRWVLEVDGQVVVDGKSLNQDLGYEEVFGWRFLDGQPLYFFKKDGHIGLSYAGTVLPHQYDEVIHYRCCEPAVFNVAGNESMVWFHALRDGTWYYVEAGVYGEQPATASGQAARPRTPVPTAAPSHGEPTPTLCEGVPALSKGTLEEAQQAVGVKVALPRDLPAGAVREEPVLYQVAGDRGMISVAYRVDQRHLAVEYVKEPGDSAQLLKGQSTTVGRFSAVVHTQPLAPLAGQWQESYYWQWPHSCEQ